MWSSFTAAFRGLARAWKTQRHFRFDVAVGLLVFAVAFFLRLTLAEWMVLLAAVTAMLVLELLNTVAEFLCDLLQPRFHGAVAIIKDVAAAAVLLGAVGVAIIGLLVFLPYLV